MKFDGPVDACISKGEAEIS
uniref:Uncharacterized protein n=1 Tax=Anguilla anguilla TaxID=7936 RepID=A0A0E9QGM9_ANGAN